MPISPNLAQALSQFGTQVANIQAQVDRLEKNQRQNNLPYSSIDNGYLTVTDDTGTVRQVIGIQADGTATTVDMNGPQPGALDTPTVTPIIQGLNVNWDGEFAGSTVYPSDYLMTQVHVSAVSGFTPTTATLAGVLHTAGNYAVMDLTPGTTYYVILAALSTSGVLGELSTQASGVPLTADTGIAPGSIVTTDIAPGSVTTPILAANAVTAAKVAANAVVAGTVAAGAIDGLTITGNVINAALINAGTLTFSDSAGGGIFGYSSGVLTVALAGAPGHDSSGYAFPAGFSIGAPGVPQVLISQDNAGAYIALPTNDASEQISAQINAEILNQGAANQQLALFLASPSDKNSTADNQWNLSMTSDSSDNTIPAQLLITDAFSIPYLSMTNGSSAGTAPTIGFGTAAGAQYPVTVNLNGVMITYGAGSGQTITQTWPNSGTFTWICPAGVTSIIVQAWGAGGGSGGGSAPSSAANGGSAGGGGEFASEHTLAVTPGNTYTFTVGAGGSGGTAGTPTGAFGGNGTNGGDTSFPGDAVTVRAHGGQLGFGGQAGGGGLGGTGSINTIHHNGGLGGESLAIGDTGGAGGGAAGSASSTGAAGTNTNSRIPGPGGTAVSGSGTGGYGGWGSNSDNGNAGGKGGLPGGGGGGGGGGTDAHTYGGAAGGAGQIKITYTQPGTAQILASLANAAGTDAYSNAFPVGYMGTTRAAQPGSTPTVVEGWHSMTVPTSSGFTGYIRCKRIAEVNMVVIDMNVSWTTTSAGTFSIGAMPSASYYPTTLASGNTGRTYPVGTNVVPGSSSSMTRLFVPTSGGLSLIIPSASSGASNVSATIMFPID